MKTMSTFLPCSIGRLLCMLAGLMPAVVAGPGCHGAPVPAPTPAPLSRAPQAPEEFHATVGAPLHMRFQLFLPREYGLDPTRRWPTILFLHGAGERGQDIAAVKVHGPPKVAEREADFPFIVVSPQCPSGAAWRDEELNALLDHVLATWTVDPDRVYLTGLSMGGFGAWSLAQASPQRFAAVVPICGGGSAIRARLMDNGETARALRALPFWAFHGAKDTVVEPAESQRMVAALREFGCDVRFTIDPDAGHDAWTKAYDDPALYAWMLAQVRGQSQGTRK